MARAERPLEAGDGALLRFAGDLRRLRRMAGNPPYRVLGRQAHYSITTLAEAAAGRKLPSLAVTLAYVHACGGDLDEWERRWQATATELAATAPPYTSTTDRNSAAPYPGWAPFQVADADRFFGRERLLTTLTKRMARQRFVLVVGASGAGTSSVLRAGLLGAARSADQTTVLMTPGAHPVRHWAAALGDHEDSAEVLLVVDQFEEVFTLCGDEGERGRFIALLIEAVQNPGRRCRIVLGLRADFLARCESRPDLGPVVAQAPVVVGAMTPDELRRAIVGPALRSGYTVESALLTTLVADVHNQPGALPLLSRALRNTWHRRRGNALTLAGYQSSGGIEGVVATTAEALYRTEPAAQQKLIRDVLVRMASLGAGAGRSHCAGPMGDIGTGADVAAVMGLLTRARLVTLDRDGVRFSHETLIRSWPRLKKWLAENPDDVRLQARLIEAARDWDEGGRQDADVYRGARLATARRWASGADRRLTEREAQFLAAGLAAEDAERLAAVRRTRRTRAVAAVLAVLAVIVTVTTAASIRACRAAAEQRDIATSRRVADAAVALRVTDPALAAQLALAAYRLSPTAPAQGALLSMSATPILSGPDGKVTVLTVGPHGRIASANESDDRNVQLWGGASQPATSLRGHIGAVNAIVFTPDGETVASAGEDRTVRLWRSTGEPLGLLRVPDPVERLAFNRDGSLLAAGGRDGLLRLWDVASPGSAGAVATVVAHAGAVRAVAFDPVGRFLATGGADRTVRLWDLVDPRRPTELAVLNGHRDTVEAVAFSPDGRTLASVSASADRTVRLWNVDGTGPPVLLGNLTGHIGGAKAVAFVSGGRMLAGAGWDGRVRLWDLTDLSQAYEPVPLTGHTGPVGVLAAGGDGRVMVTGGEDRMIIVWDLDPQKVARQICATAWPPITRAEWVQYVPGRAYRPPCPPAG